MEERDTITEKTTLTSLWDALVFFWCKCSNLTADPLVVQAVFVFWFVFVPVFVFVLTGHTSAAI